MLAAGKVHKWRL